MCFEFYKNLGDHNDETRQDAAKFLTTELLSTLGGERTERSKADVDYALQRLTKGLASGRESARRGFAIVLTELLHNLMNEENRTKWDVSLEQVIQIVVDNTEPKRNIKSQEERDYYLGRLFGLQSLIQSHVLFISTDALQKYAYTLDLIFDLSRKKLWLQESCGWTITSSIVLWPKEISAQAAVITYQKLCESKFGKTSEGVGIWMTLQARHPSIKPSFEFWENDSPFSMSNLPKIANILKESDSKDDPAIKSKGSWNPKLSYVWDYILHLYFSEDVVWKQMRERDTIVADWKEFWRVVVDGKLPEWLKLCMFYMTVVHCFLENLFSNSSSDERKYWGLLFFSKTLDCISAPEHAGPLFSTNFMRCFVYHMGSPERFLNKLANKTLKALFAKCESAPWMVPVVFKEITSINSAQNLDQVIKSKILEKITCLADASGLSEIVVEVKRIILDPMIGNEEEVLKLAENRRQWAADQILWLVRNGKTVKAENWLRKVVELFATLGHYEILSESRAPKIPLSITTQSMLRSRLMSCLSHLVSLDEGKMANGESWPYLAVRTINNMKFETHSKCTIELDQTIENSLEEAMETVAGIRKSSQSGRDSNTHFLAFEILYSLLILQVYNGESDALFVLEELKSVQSKLISQSAPPKKRSKTKSEVDSAEILIDVILSFLARQSVLLRKVAYLVFTSCSLSMTNDALGRCFDVLSTTEGLSGQQELFDKEDSENDDNELSILGSDNGLPSDAETLSGSGDEDGVDKDAWEALEEDLNNLIQPPGSGEEDMGINDEEMLKMDEKITEIFKKQRLATTKKNKEKEARDLIINFKSKVLDLLEIYSKTASKSVLNLEILVPCLTLARHTRDQNLVKKSIHVVKTLSLAIKRDTVPVFLEPQQIDRAWDILQEVHEEAGKGGSVQRKSACSIASLIMVKSLVRHNAAVISRVSDLYSRSLTRWATQQDFNVDNSLFNDFVGWVGDVRNMKAKRQKDLEVRETESKKKTKRLGKKKKVKVEAGDGEQETITPKKRKSQEPEDNGLNKKKRKSKLKNKW